MRERRDREEENISMKTGHYIPFATFKGNTGPLLGPESFVDNSPLILQYVVPRLMQWSLVKLKDS